MPDDNPYSTSSFAGGDCRRNERIMIHIGPLPLAHGWNRCYTRLRTVRKYGSSTGDNGSIDGPHVLRPNDYSFTRLRMVTIRPETPNDHDAVRRVTVDAFTDGEFGHNGEADLVDQLRNNCDDLLALVAAENHTIVGHILFSPVLVRTTNGVVQGKGLAPMAVAPDRQKAGIGSALVESGLKELAVDRCPFVVVLGHPDYYPRFGFQPGSQHRLSHGFDGIPQDIFFIKILDQNAVQSFANGTAIYRPEFGPQRDGTEQADAVEP